MEKIAVITGAGTGIGRATAKRLAQSGFQLALIGRDIKRLEETASSVKEDDVHCTLCTADVSNGEKLMEIAQKIENNGNVIDVWVNCAGAGLFGEAASLSTNDVGRAISVTCLGSINGTLAALHCMRRRGEGHIINLDLDVRFRDLPLTACENASRAGVRAFSESLRAEIRHKKDRIHVTTVELPAINTPRYNWTKNTAGKIFQPLTPLYQPEVAAQAICQAIFSPSDSIAIGPRHFFTRFVNFCFPSLRKLWVDEHGYDQLSHDWAQGQQSDNLHTPLDAAYNTQGAYSTDARSASHPLSFAVSSKMLSLVRAALTVLAAGLIFNHCRKHDEHEKENA